MRRPVRGDPVVAEGEAGVEAEVEVPVAAEVEVEAEPSDPASSLEDLEQEITTLAAHVHAAEHRLLLLIAEFDRREGWKVAGHASCADWLHFRTGYDRGTARERVRTARALEGLPQISEAMSRGELSFSKVRALSRLSGVLNGPEAEGEVLDFARQVTTAELERVVRGWKLLGRLDEAERERRRHGTRRLSIFPDDDGMYVVHGRIDPEVGAALMRAVEAASDALYRKEPDHQEGCDRQPVHDWAAEGGRKGPRSESITPKQRRADAIGLVAERALAAGFGRRAATGGDEAAAEQDAEAGALAGSSEAEETPPLSGSRAERYQVVIHVDAAELATPGTGHDAPGVSAETPGRSGDPRSFRSAPHREPCEQAAGETARRLCCDAAVVPVTRSRGGGVLDVGRKTRTVSPALRRALDARDGGCRFPGCGLRFTEAHHIIHWSDGGETSLENTLLVCRRHHRALHEEGFRVKRLRDGRLRFFDRTGWPLPDMAPPPPLLGADPVDALLRQNRDRHVDPDGWTCSSRWKRSEDIPWSLEVAVLEALDP